MRIVNVGDVTAVDTPFPGVTRKTLAYGDRMPAIQTILRRGAVAPPHSHHHEQLSYCLDGSVEVAMEGQKAVCKAGGSWVVPGGVEHSARAIEDSLTVEVFGPVREEFIEHE